MAIHIRNKQGEIESYKILGLKGEDGITPNIQIGTVNTVPPDQEASVVKRGTKEEPIFDFNIPRGASGNSNESGGSSSISIDDNTISKDKTWSSSKIEDFTLTNVGAIWKEINGEAMVIDSTMDGFLREVEILGNTTQNQDDLSNIQHLGVWNEEKQGYEIEIVISSSSSEDDLNYQEHRTIIVLPCQLMKVGNIVDRLYWDKDKGRYVIEKNIYKYSFVELDITSKPQNDNTTFHFGIDNVVMKLIFDDGSMGYSPIGICNKGLCQKPYFIHWGNGSPSCYGKNVFGGITNRNNKTMSFAGRIRRDEGVSDIATAKQWIKDNDVYCYYRLQTPELINTNIREELKLPTFMNNTYISVNGGIQGSIKAKAPIDGGKVIGVLENKNKELETINKEQDELINTTMLATDEILTVLEPLLVDLLSNNSSSKIIDMYVAMVKSKRGLKTIDEVPLRYREQVKEIISESMNI